MRLFYPHFLDAHVLPILTTIFLLYTIYTTTVK